MRHRRFHGLTLVLLLVGSWWGVVEFLRLGEPGASGPWLEIPSALASDSTTIGFYGVPIESDAVVWCFDRSASLAGPGFEAMKLEIVGALQQLPLPQEFSAVSFSTAYQPFSVNLLPADPATVDSVSSWVLGQSPDGTTCLTAPIIAAIEIAEQASTSCVVLVSDGLPTCGGETADSVIAAVQAANPMGIPIHCFSLSSSPGALAFFEAIAGPTGGIVVDVQSAMTRFQRGDVNSDSVSDISDAVFLLAAGFVPGSAQPTCDDAADVNDDGLVEFLVDSIFLLQTVFLTSAPKVPFPAATCGIDPTPDGIDCTLACP